jgi:hypothetical protein
MPLALVETAETPLSGARRELQAANAALAAASEELAAVTRARGHDEIRWVFLLAHR